MGESDKIGTLINEREQTHGSWADNARVSNLLWEALRSGAQWENLPASQRAALAMAAHKFSRIVNGDWREIDHWRDAAGYIKLGEP